LMVSAAVAKPAANINDAKAVNLRVRIMVSPQKNRECIRGKIQALFSASKTIEVLGADT
jgi:hypothetical protein